MTFVKSCNTKGIRNLIYSLKKIKSVGIKFKRKRGINGFIILIILKY